MVLHQIDWLSTSVIDTKCSNCWSRSIGSSRLSVTRNLPTKVPDPSRLDCLDGNLLMTWNLNGSQFWALPAGNMARMKARNCVTLSESKSLCYFLLLSNRKKEQDKLRQNLPIEPKPIAINNNQRCSLLFATGKGADLRRSMGSFHFRKINYQTLCEMFAIYLFPNL